MEIPPNSILITTPTFTRVTVLTIRPVVIYTRFHDYIFRSKKKEKTSVRSFTPNCNVGEMFYLKNFC